SLVPIPLRFINRADNIYGQSHVSKSLGGPGLISLTFIIIFRGKVRTTPVIGIGYAIPGQADRRAVGKYQEIFHVALFGSTGKPHLSFLSVPVICTIFSQKGPCSSPFILYTAGLTLPCTSRSEIKPP